jgi:hypothetical protein
MPELQPWTIAVIAGFGVLIAYFQWRTAHQRVVLDLFDRRLQTFELAEQACTNIVSSAKPSLDDLRRLHRAKGQARFLFGEDVNSYLRERIADCALLMSMTDEVIDARPDAQRHALIDKKSEALMRIANFPDVAAPIFTPYMRLTQKMPSTWLPS